MTSKQPSLLESASYLTGADDAPELYADIKAILGAAKSIDARFSGDRSILNPLVELALEDPDKFERVIDLVDSKRRAAGYTSIINEVSAKRYEKADYMRDFMAQKRARESRAADIENLMRPEEAQLRGRSRTDFMQMQAAKWKTQRDQAIEAARKASGGRLRKDQTQEVLRQFWDRLDRELDDLEELARLELRQPQHLRKRK